MTEGVGGCPCWGVSAVTAVGGGGDHRSSSLCHPYPKRGSEVGRAASLRARSVFLPAKERRERAGGGWASRRAPAGVVAGRHAVLARLGTIPRGSCCALCLCCLSTFPPRAAARVGVGGGDAPPQTFDAARRRRRAAAVANGACRRRQRRCARVVACRPVHGGAGRRGARGGGAVSSAPHGGFCPGAVYSGSRVDAGGGGGAGGAGHRHACRRLRPCRRWCEGGPALPPLLPSRPHDGGLPAARGGAGGAACRRCRR